MFSHQVLTVITIHKGVTSKARRERQEHLQQNNEDGL